jgi:hypothetical protein
MCDRSKRPPASKSLAGIASRLANNAGGGMAGIYGEDHENNINALFGPFRIASTAKKSADLENSKCSPRCWS